MVAKMPRGSRAYVIRELIFDDLDCIAANLRPADAKEFEIASGHANFRDRLTMCARTRPSRTGSPVRLSQRSARTAGICRTLCYSPRRRLRLLRVFLSCGT